MNIPDISNYYRQLTPAVDRPYNDRLSEADQPPKVNQGQPAGEAVWDTPSIIIVMVKVTPNLSQSVSTFVIQILQTGNYFTAILCRDVWYDVTNYLCQV